MTQPIRVGITHGDINGISYEIIVKTLDDDRFTELCTPVIFGLPRLALAEKKSQNAEMFSFVTIDTAADAKPGKINIVQITDEDVKPEAGKPSETAGRLALLSLEAGCAALEAGEIDVLVTAPINKNTIQSEEFHFPGHTEYLESRFGGDESKSLMILYNDSLRVALVTTHLPVAEISPAITKERVADTVRRFNASLRRDFRIDHPRIAVLALNPHCGDGGLLGSEEETVITPAINECREENMDVFGPFAADGFFASDNVGKFDGVVAMYHDQGLAPFKALAGKSGVNFTAGLPVVRTSPDHGTGYDLAGKNMADPTSMRMAIYEAIDIFRHRQEYDRPLRNPLRKQYVERGADKTVDLSKEDPML